MTDDLTLRCACGALTGCLAGRTAKAGTHIVCHCRDCRAFQVAVGRDDPGADRGVNVLQIGPAGLKITGDMAAIRMSPRGPFRFYAACCGTPIATTMTKPTIPFAGLLTAVLEDPDRLGPVRANVNITGADGSVKHKRIGRVVRAIFSNAGSACLRGERKVTPFFDPETGAPVVEPVVIDKERKAEIYRAL